MDNSNYHVIIIAAGSSRRLAHLTRDKPKSFLPVGNKKIIEHSLDYLNGRGFKRVTFVVGYLKELFMQTLGNKHKNLDIDYIISDDYQIFDHCWSTFLSKQAWQQEKKPVIFIHADTVYHPKILDKVLAHPFDNVVGVDNTYQVLTGDECVVTGKDGIMTGFKDGIPIENSKEVGELIGINKWSADYMEQFYDFMEDYFTKHGKNHKYEPVLDAFIKEKGLLAHYVESDGLPWVNINYEDDYRKVQGGIL